MTELQLDLLRRLSAQCARKEHCLADLRQKLLRSGLTPAEGEEVLARLRADGFVDEARYARAFVSDKYRFDRWGRVKIRHALRQKGVGEDDIADALATIDETEYLDALDAFLRGKCGGAEFPHDYAARQKLARAAAARGYEPHLVFSRLRMDDC